MKNLIILSILISVLMSCKRAENTDITPLNETPSETAIVKNVGNFMDGDGEKATGKASIFLDNKVYKLAFEDLSVNNGPNLHVYLSKEIKPKNFYDLGDLKSIKGNQVYQIPDGVEATTYKYALVYCKKYSHLFGYAALK